VAAALVRTYLLANALLVLAALILLIVRAGSARVRRPISYRQQLQLGYILIVVALVGPCLVLPSGGADILPMTTQVWSAPSMEALRGSGENLGSATISAGDAKTSVSLDLLMQTIVVVCLAGFLLALTRILAGARSVGRVLRQAHLIRRAGALRILATDEAIVPFSCWVPGACHIVVPSALISRPEDFRIALRHEGQHHRQGDTRIIYAMEFLRGAFFLNPMTHVLLRQLRGLQEFACDETLISRRRVNVRAYCDCLVRVAQSRVRSRDLPACLHMADPEGASMLSRRIRAVLEKPRQYLQRRAVFAVNVLAVLTILTTGIVLSGAVQDRRVSLAHAQDMADVARAESPFPIVVNEQVLAELNRFLGTPDGRAFMRDALTRMDTHEALISARLAQHGLPQELLAVPLVESGYRNLEQSEYPQHGAGIWMFIKPTAQRFGLEVESGKDERLSIPSETEAAMKMFSSLHSEFGDWGFALLAYNGGSELVRRAVRELGANDAFVAAQHGYENDPGYVARVMAAIIVWRNRHRLQLGTAIPAAP
jgi:beta-lactamase regulating signal transducer with metallopeptidase domain